MADKESTLSIVIRTVDQATAKIKAINERLDAVTKPVRDFKSALGDLAEKSGLNGVISGFKGVGDAVMGVLGKVAMIAGVAGVAVVALKSMIDEFDNLGDESDRLGVSVDFIAQMRYAAELAGTTGEKLDTGLQAFTTNLGKARAGMGRMVPFLKGVAPVLLQQLVAAKSTEEAWKLLSNAMSKLTDPAKRSALAMMTVGDVELGPLLEKGAAGMGALGAEFSKSAGSMGPAAKAAGATDDAFKKLSAATKGVKAALVTGLAPAMTIIVGKLAEVFTSHREDIEKWATKIGKELPKAAEEFALWIGKAYDKVAAFVDSIGGLKNAAIGVGLIIAGPLIGSIVGLSVALLTAIGRAGALGLTIKSIPPVPGVAGAAGTGAAVAGAAGKPGLGLLGVLAPLAAASWLNDISGGSINDGKGGVMGIARERLDLERNGNQTSDVLEQSRSTIGRYRAQIDTQALAKDIATAFAMNPATAVRIAVDIGNAPQGTRASSDAGANVDLSLGLQMLGLQ